jgi:hypothetical protein
MGLGRVNYGRDGGGSGHLRRKFPSKAGEGRGDTIWAQRFSPPLSRTLSPPRFRSPLRSPGSSRSDCRAAREFLRIRTPPASLCFAVFRRGEPFAACTHSSPFRRNSAAAAVVVNPPAPDKTPAPTRRAGPAGKTARRPRESAPPARANGRSAVANVRSAREWARSAMANARAAVAEVRSAKAGARAARANGRSARATEGSAPADGRSARAHLPSATAGGCHRSPIRNPQPAIRNSPDYWLLSTDYRLLPPPF